MITKVIAKLSPKGYEEVGRAHLIDPTNKDVANRRVVWVHPAFANKCVFVRNDADHSVTHYLKID